MRLWGFRQMINDVVLACAELPDRAQGGAMDQGNMISLQGILNDNLPVGGDSAPKVVHILV